MPATPTSDIALALAHNHEAVQHDQPVLTYCDAATGERVELSAPTLGSWAARTAGLLHRGCGLYSGARVGVLLPPHWQTAAVLLGAWSAGIAVAYRPWATAGLGPAGDDVDEPLDAVFVAQKRLESWLEAVPQARFRFVLGLAPNGARMVDIPPGYRDYLAEVYWYPNTPPAYQSIRNDAPASPDGTSYQEWAALARDFADSQGLHAGDRLLVDVAAHEQPVMWLLAPLTVGASVVLCANHDRHALDVRIAAEHITHVL